MNVKPFAVLRLLLSFTLIPYPINHVQIHQDSKGRNVLLNIATSNLGT